MKNEKMTEHTILNQSNGYERTGNERTHKNETFEKLTNRAVRVLSFCLAEHSMMNPTLDSNKQ